MAIRAPVLPADTAACAVPSFTCAIATRIDESFFRRSATSIESSMPTTSVATTIRARGCTNALRDSGRPTSRSSASGCCSRKYRHAGNVTLGPWSPPMQSTARVIMGNARHRHGGFGRNDRKREASKQRPDATQTVAPGPRVATQSGFGLGLEYLAATVEAVRTDVVTQMRFASGRLQRNARHAQGVVRAVHAAFGR